MRWTELKKTTGIEGVVGVGLALAMLILTSGCATGLSANCLAVAQSGKPLARLLCDAERGNPAAQLALGRLYEDGRGVDRDPARAASLYAAAAADVAPTTAIYVPPVGRAAGHVMLVQNPNARIGLAAARYRLGLLYLQGIGVDRDEERGRRFIDQAAAAGDPDAIGWLKQR